MSFKFIDLFAGIGGIRIAFKNAGGECVFSSEYDRFAQETYKAFFDEYPHFQHIKEVQPPGDITKLEPEKVPPHNILTGGFPCQPFSLAGVSKKQSLGRPHGFSDPTQGTLFFNVKEIIKEKKPEAFLLENVKNLRSHDNGNTFDIIMTTLRSLDYDVFENVIDAKPWVPQHRERIFIVGFRKPEADPSGKQKWRIGEFPELDEKYLAEKYPGEKKNLSQILEKMVPVKYTLGQGTWATLERHKAHHAAIGQGFGYGMIVPPFKNRITRTISARYHKDGAEVLIKQKGPIPRRLTPLECLRLMGFPADLEVWFNRNGAKEQPVSDTQAYRQFGNAVVVPKVEAIARAMVKKMEEAGAIRA